VNTGHWEYQGEYHSHIVGS